MRLYTPVDISPAPFRFDYQDEILLMGSCFSDNMGKIMEEEKFRVDINPFGTLYNPASLSAAIRRLLGGKTYGAGELIEHEGLFHSLDHHGQFSAPDAEACLAKINERFIDAAVWINAYSRLIVTFGSAYVYRLEGRIVANCHKLPERLFQRERLTVEAIAEDWITLIDEFAAVNPKARWLLTVSPIRHFRDGAHENQLSKATLLLAIDQIQRARPGRVAYFPAYELLMDELRDYRFYADDLVHPSLLAVRHVWERFAETCLTAESQAALQEWQALRKALEHRPLRPESEAYRRFAHQTLLKMERFHEKFPSFDLAKEKASLLRQVSIITEEKAN